MVNSVNEQNIGGDLRLGVPCGGGLVAMVDTGAQISVIDFGTFKYLQHLTRQVTPLADTRVRPRSVSGDTIPVEGRCTIELPGLPRHHYIVCRDLPCPVILGNDFCIKHRVLIDYQKRRVQISGNWVSSASLRPDDDRICFLAEEHEEIYQEFRDVFGANGDLGEAKGFEVSIETEGPPIRQRAYRVPLVKRRAVREQVQKLLDKGIIRPSSSAWASPVVIVPKKSGDLRLCIDYRKINNVTVKNAHPLPNIRDVFDQLQGSSYFSLLDLDSGYHQIRLDEASIPKTAFTCEMGLFEYLRLPFGLNTAPACFQRMMNVVLSEIIGNGCFVYIDDIVIYGRTKEEHDQNLRRVLLRLREYGLRTKLSKCEICVRVLKLLGHIVDKDGIHTDPEKCAAISKMPRPFNAREVRRFLGATGYYRDLIPGYARLASPLYKLTHKESEFSWSPECAKAFNQLKTALLSDNCVAYPDINRPYNLYTDACDYAMGAVLTQTDPDTDREKAVYYISHQFSGPQKRWPTIEKEAYAVVFAIEKLRPYILGCPGVNVYTDHKPLTSLFTELMRNTKIQRWAILLSQYNVNISYIKGVNNVKADFLSRLRNDPAPPEDEILSVMLNFTPTERLQETATMLMIDAVPQEPYPRAGAPLAPQTLEVLRFDEIPTGELCRQQQAEYSQNDFKSEDNVVIDGVLCSLLPPTREDATRPRILLPSQFRQGVINKAHAEVGHASTARTLKRVREAYLWKGMSTDVARYVSLCAICVACKRKREYVEMGEGPTPALPDQVIAMDLIGPFVRDGDGYKFALVIIDHCTNWVEAYPLKTKSNLGVRTAFIERYLPYHASPHLLITDNGTEFSSPEWREYLVRHAITHQLTTPYHPQSNGKVERVNRTIKEMLARLSNNNLSRWTEVLPEVVKIINATPTRATGFPPFVLQTGREPRLPIMFNLGVNSDVFQGDRADFLTRAIHDAQHQQQSLREENRRRINQRANAGPIHRGDRVMVWVEVPGTHTTRWDPGYRVIRIRQDTIWVTHVTNGGERVLHRDKVKVVDPALVWDELAPRVSRYQIRKATRGKNAPAIEADEEQDDEAPPLPPRARRQHPALPARRVPATPFRNVPVIPPRVRPNDAGRRRILQEPVVDPHPVRQAPNRGKSKRGHQPRPQPLVEELPELPRQGPNDLLPPVQARVEPRNDVANTAPAVITGPNLAPPQPGPSTRALRFQVRQQRQAENAAQLQVTAPPAVDAGPPNIPQESSCAPNPRRYNLRTKK